MTAIEKLEKQLAHLIAQHGTGGAEHLYISDSPAYSEAEDGYYLIVNWAGSEDGNIKPTSETVDLGSSYKEAKASLEEYFAEPSKEDDCP